MGIRDGNFWPSPPKPIGFWVSSEFHGWADKTERKCDSRVCTVTSCNTVANCNSILDGFWMLIKYKTCISSPESILKHMQKTSTNFDLLPAIHQSHRTQQHTLRHIHHIHQYLMDSGCWKNVKLASPIPKAAWSILANMLAMLDLLPIQHSHQ